MRQLLSKGRHEVSNWVYETNRTCDCIDTNATCFRITRLFKSEIRRNCVEILEEQQ
jgi:hypothetical protein